MTNPFLFPFQDDADFLERHCRLPLHVGTARITRHGLINHPAAEPFRELQRLLGRQEPDPSDIEYDASFIVPATGRCLIFLRSKSSTRPSLNFGEGLSVIGQSAEGPFELHCPDYSAQVVSDRNETDGWAIVSPWNSQATVAYGAQRSVHKVIATLNNFDFEYGNLRTEPSGEISREVLRVQASGRDVDFAWRENRLALRRLIDAGVLYSSALTTFSFTAWEGAREEDLSAFAHNVASLCAIIMQQHTGIPVLSFLDADRRMIKRFIGNSIESEFRSECALRFPHADDALPKLFRQCFDEHARMQASKPWRRMPFMLAAIQDSPYLEQKITTLMAALELLLRNVLSEAGHCPPPRKRSPKKKLGDLLSAARNHLGWNIPKHYIMKNLHISLRNCAVHGDELPASAKQVRHDFDKWRLFLMRRLLIRLGYDGNVASPHRGCASSSHVADFSEEHNSFLT